MDSLPRHPLVHHVLRKRVLCYVAAALLQVYVWTLLAWLLVEVLGGGAGQEPWSGSWWAIAAVGVLIILVQVLAVQGSVLATFQREGLISLHPKDESGGRTFGGMTGPEIVRLVHEVAARFGIGHIDRIVITERPDPNAFTGYLLGVGNVVVLHSNLIEIMPRAGVRAIVAHEVAHIHRGDSLRTHLTHLPWRFVEIAIVLAAVKLIIDWHTQISWFALGAEALLLAALAVTAVLAYRLLQRVLIFASQQGEFLADVQAARVCGWENSLNALLFIGERSEAIVALMGALHHLAGRLDDTLSERALLRIINRFPPRELDEKRAIELAPRLYIEDQLEALRSGLCVPLTPEQIRHLAALGARRLEKVKEEEVLTSDTPVEPAEEITDWRWFDTDQSGHLDSVETAALVAELRLNPKRMLFREFLGDDAGWASHPTFRERILFLHDVFGVHPEG